MKPTRYSISEPEAEEEAGLLSVFKKAILLKLRREED